MRTWRDGPRATAMSISGVKLEGTASAAGGSASSSDRTMRALVSARWASMWPMMPRRVAAEDEAGDEGPAGDEFGGFEGQDRRRARRRPARCGQVAEARVGRHHLAVGGAQRAAELYGDAEQGLAGPVGALAHFRRERCRFGETVGGRDQLEVGGEEGTTQQHAVHGLPAAAEVIRDEAVELVRGVEHAVGGKAFDAPGKCEAAGRVGAVAVLQEG